MATLDEARLTLLRREDARTAALEARRAQLRSRLPAAADLLRDRFGARTVCVFGCLKTGDNAGDIDVDLAVSGLHGPDDFKALSALSRLFGEPVELEAAPKSLRRRIAMQGRHL